MSQRAALPSAAGLRPGRGAARSAARAAEVRPARARAGPGRLPAACPPGGGEAIRTPRCRALLVRAYCCAQMGYEGRRCIGDTTDSNAGLHVAITALEAARNNPGGNAEGFLAEVRTAATTLANNIRSLRELCVARGWAAKSTVTSQ